MEEGIWGEEWREFAARSRNRPRTHLIRGAGDEGKDPYNGRDGPSPRVEARTRAVVSFDYGSSLSLFSN